MYEQIHFASQYLATAGKSFLTPRKDDSHTNLGYDVDRQLLETWSLNDAHLKLALDLKNFSIRWMGNEAPEFLLDGKTHGEVVTFLKNSAQQMDFGSPYEFDLHYELPFPWGINYVFSLADPEKLIETARLRAFAHRTLRSFLAKENLDSDIRIWPHHFDTGAFVVLKESGKSVGLGMAIPDAVCDDHYFYISGYRGHQAIDTNNFENLVQGEWKANGFKGGVLPVSTASNDQAVAFFQEAFSSYLLFG